MNKWNATRFTTAERRCKCLAVDTVRGDLYFTSWYGLYVVPNVYEKCKHKSPTHLVKCIAGFNGIVFDGKDTMYICDCNGYILKWDVNQKELEYPLDESQLPVAFGSKERHERIDGDIKNAAFRFPTEITRDKYGNYYVIDGHTIRKIWIEKGIVETIAGVVFRYQLDRLTGIAADEHGIVYVTDFLNHCVKRIQNGIVSTIVGMPDAPIPDNFNDLQLIEGPLDKTLLCYPMDILLDADGSLLITCGTPIEADIEPFGYIRRIDLKKSRISTPYSSPDRPRRFTLDDRGNLFCFFNDDGMYLFEDRKGRPGCVLDNYCSGSNIGFQLECTKRNLDWEVEEYR